MKLYYCNFPKSNTNNFGDDLNPWLWHKLLPDVLDEDDCSRFIAMGTLINNRLRLRFPNPTKLAIFSTGVGYGSIHFGDLPSDNLMKIYCLRGPLSASALGVDSNLAIADGALLVRRFFDIGDSQKSYKFSFMPHLSQAIPASKIWKNICNDLGFRYIDPRCSVEEVLSLISQTEVLITEAMHGAIVADALRVSWIPVYTNPHIFSFKWLDWCLSIGVKYQPKALPNLSFNPYDLRNIRYFDWNKKQKALNKLAQIADFSIPNLSDASKIESLTIQLEEKLQMFKKDVGKGYFQTTI
ncbi:MAG: polysaccharide pyruvyl transferase family protein [Pleurocapsa sp. MO_192.B19]|nr:polysaccharide pyruvyl transferase family protein [Pleurocapsa sp. MO_192.B19]